MEDSSLFKIVLITSILGIIGTMVFANDISPREIKISEINRGVLDEDVTLEGVIIGVKKSSATETYFLDIMDGTGRCSLVIFESNVRDLEKSNLTISNLNNRRVKVTGKITEYQGRLEIILKDASSLKLLA